MAILHPFKAWRPTQDTIYEIACVPYDVIDTDEARVLAAGKPNSFLHVIRPEIDLEETIDVHADSNTITTPVLISSCPTCRT